MNEKYIHKKLLKNIYIQSYVVKSLASNPPSSPQWPAWQLFTQGSASLQLSYGNTAARIHACISPISTPHTHHISRSALAFFIDMLSSGLHGRCARSFFCICIDRWTKLLPIKGYLSHFQPFATSAGAAMIDLAFTSFAC